ncbi:MAG TPA: hypothetical protein DCQ06_00640, partial [Myxococcales bacterium]|nr:hypothetical protein [Myxococcales bacterium]
MKRPIIMRFGLQRVLLLAVVVGATSACIPPRLSDPTAIDASGDVEQGKDLSGGSCAIDDDCPAGDNPCLKPVCQKARSGGRECAFKSKTNGTDCDDNDPCTAVSTCSKGKCEGGGNQCQCEADNKDNCYKQFQGLYSKTNKCLSLADCAVEKGTGIWKCVPQAPPIQCPTDSDNSCQTNTCNTGTGQCQLIKKKPGYACEDGIACGESACDAKGSCSMVSYAGCGCNPQNGVPEGNICWNREYSIDGTKYTTSYASRKCTGEILCLPVTEDGKTKYDCVLDMFTIKFCGEDDSACI